MCRSPLKSAFSSGICDSWIHRADQESGLGETRQPFPRLTLCRHVFRGLSRFADVAKEPGSDEGDGCVGHWDRSLTKVGAAMRRSHRCDLSAGMREGKRLQYRDHDDDSVRIRGNVLTGGQEASRDVPSWLTLSAFRRAVWLTQVMQGGNTRYAISLES